MTPRLSKWYVFIGLLAAAQLSAEAGYMPMGVALFALDLVLVAYWLVRGLWRLARPAPRREPSDTFETTLAITKDGETTRYRSRNGVRVRSTPSGLLVSDWDERPLEPVS